MKEGVVACLGQEGGHPPPLDFGWGVGGGTANSAQFLRGAVPPLHAAHVAMPDSNVAQIQE